MSAQLLYLAYGSNLLGRRLRERAPSARARGVVRLAGWELRFHKRSVDGSGKCGIRRSPAVGAAVWGVVYEIDAGERRWLDRAEFVGDGYESLHLAIELVGEPLAVFTYVAQPAHIDEDLAPYRWYLDLVVAGARRRRLPRDYVRRLAATRAIDDPDRRRAARHRGLLDATGQPLPERRPPSR